MSKRIRKVKRLHRPDLRLCCFDNVEAGQYLAASPTDGKPTEFEYVLRVEKVEICNTDSVRLDGFSFFMIGGAKRFKKATYSMIGCHPKHNFIAGLYGSLLYPEGRTNKNRGVFIITKDQASRLVEKFSGQTVPSAFSYNPIMFTVGTNTVGLG
jgi:hypothetical protein